MCLIFEDVMWSQRWRGWDSPGKGIGGWDQGGVSGYEVKVISRVTGRSAGKKPVFRARQTPCVALVIRPHRARRPTVPAPRQRQADDTRSPSADRKLSRATSTSLLSQR